MGKTIWHIPQELMIHAVNETLAKFKGYCADKWGEMEASHCRKVCGDKYEHIETDWIRKQALALRKSGKLISVNGGPKRKRVEKPIGEYARYLTEPHWLAFRLEVLEFWNYQCCLCCKRAEEVHHNTYVRRGNERLTDCVALCKKCHMRVHGVMADGNEAFSSELVDELF